MHINMRELVKDNYKQFKVISINLPKIYVDVLELFKSQKIYPSKTELIRNAIRQLLFQEIELIQALQDRETLEKIRKIPNFIEFKKELSDFEKYINQKIIGIA